MTRVVSRAQRRVTPPSRVNPKRCTGCWELECIETKPLDGAAATW